MTPLYFGNCFGWLHPATGKRGVVICSAIGIEDLCTHRFMRQLGNELAAAGIPTFRFDYHGTGDSLGDNLDPNRVQSWLNSVREAIEFVRNETQVDEIALVGFRIGSLLATTVAAQRDGISMLALVGPVTSGKSYLREMKMLNSLIAPTLRGSTRKQITARETTTMGIRAKEKGEPQVLAFLFHPIESKRN